MIKIDVKFLQNNQVDLSDLEKQEVIAKNFQIMVYCVNSMQCTI